MRIPRGIFLVVPALCAVICTNETTGPVDLDQEDPPTVSLDTSASGILAGDTIHFDSGTVSLVGNSEKSEFRMKIDTGSWSEWDSTKSRRITELDDGRHVIHLNTRYSGEDEVVEDSVVFYVKVSGYHPEFTSTDDTSIVANAGSNVTLTAEADGADSMYYQWYKDGTVIRYATVKSLPLESVTSRDTGKYRCIITNEFGIDTGRVFTLKVLVSKGSITGTVTNGSDTAGRAGVRILLLPDSTDTVTGSSGAFTFVNLSAGTYRLHISATLYADTTIDSIIVKDTGVTAKGNILLARKNASDLPWGLSYDGNGSDHGNAPKDSNSYLAGEKAVVAANSDSLTKTGHYFAGWNTKKDGSGTNFSAGDTLVFDTMNVILYARWTDIPLYTVTYHAPGSNSGSVPKDERKYEHGTTVTVRSNSGTLGKNGYTFAGWNTAENGDGTSFMPGDTFVVDSASVELYARWSINRYTISYNGNGSQTGTAPPDSSYTFGDSATVRSHGNLARTGYTFIAWSTAADGNGTTVLEGKRLPVGATDITLYAQWKVNQYFVIYDGNGNTGGSAPDIITVKYGDSLRISGRGDLLKTGHTFNGWNTAANGSGTFYRADTAFVMGLENIKLYARWDINRYQVHYDTRGGNTLHDTTVNYNDTVPRPATPVRTGYVFAGWYREAACVNVWNFANDKITAPDTLYAKWNDPAGMVMIHAKDSTFSMGTTLYDEQPVHDVKFTGHFWMDSTEVTQAQYEAFMSSAYGSDYSSPDWTSSIGLGDNYPAYFANWYDAALYCNARTKATGSKDTFYVYTSRIGKAGDSCILVSPTFNWNSKGFRLPTEAQWEYACKAGTNTAFYWGKNWVSYPDNDADSNEIDSYAIWWRNSEHKGSGHAGYGTSQVGRKVKNGFSLYDMSGNLAEWCNDLYAGNYGNNTLKVDPKGPATGNSRVYRGGSWTSVERYLRSPARDDAAPNSISNEIGFRTCLPAQ